MVMGLKLEAAKITLSSPAYEVEVYLFSVVGEAFARLVSPG